MNMDQEELKVRRARPEDRDALHALLTRSWRTTWAPHCTQEAVAFFERSDPVGSYLDACLGGMEVAELSGAVVAMLHMVKRHVAALHVDPELKGRGIGSQLMTAAEARDVETLEVRGFNTEAIRFYERRGWERTSTYQGSEMGDSVETHEYCRNTDRPDERGPAPESDTSRC